MVSLLLGYWHVIIGDTLLLQLWSTVHKVKIRWLTEKKMQNWCNLIFVYKNTLNNHFQHPKNLTLIDVKKCFATDIMYIVCLWHFLEAYKYKRYAQSKLVNTFWVPICTLNPNKLILTCFCTWLTGDDGSSDEPQQGVLVKESESLYTLWCTGRVGCDGMLVEIKVHAVANILVLKLVSRYVDFFWRGGGQRHETLSWREGYMATWIVKVK